MWKIRVKYLYIYWENLLFLQENSKLIRSRNRWPIHFFPQRKAYRVPLPITIFLFTLFFFYVLSLSLSLFIHLFYLRLNQVVCAHVCRIQGQEKIWPGCGEMKNSHVCQKIHTCITWIYAKSFFRIFSPHKQIIISR